MVPYAKKNPTEGGMDRLLGGVVVLARCFRIAVLAAPIRMNRSAAVKVIPINLDSLWVPVSPQGREKRRNQVKKAVFASLFIAYSLRKYKSLRRRAWM
jgi:hypothetical protein